MSRKLTIDVLLAELDRRNISLSLRGDVIVTEPEAPPGLRSTIKLLEHLVLSHLLSRSSQGSPPARDHRPSTDLSPSDNRSYPPPDREGGVSTGDKNHYPRQTPPMPAEIQAAYDRGEFMGTGEHALYAEARNRWEVEAASAQPKELSDAALDLLERFHAGTLPKRIHDRLAELFATDPPDIFERLERAARYVSGKATAKPPVQAEVRIINAKTASKEERAKAEYVGRENKRYGLPQSPLHNPFKDGDRATSIAKYRKHLLNALKEDPTVAQEFSRLLGQLEQEGAVTLMCWCAPKACHAEVIRDLLLEPASERAA